VECKPLYELKSESLRVRLTRIGRHLGSAGIAFVVVTEDSLANPVATQNALRMAKALRDRECVRALSAIRAAIDSYRPTSFGQLLEQLGARKAAAAIAHGVRYVDVHRSMDHDARLMIWSEENCDAADFLFAQQPYFPVQPDLSDRFDLRTEAARAA
jgi:hypothetical protein